MPLALVILAAGAGRRLGRDKALVPLSEDERSSPLERLLAAGRSLTDRPPLVVTGAHHDAVAEALAKEGSLGAELGVEVVHNERWDEGRTGSVQQAVAARPSCDLCLAPVDVPLVPAVVFDALSAAWDDARRPARGWLAPCVRDARAGPVAPRGAKRRKGKASHATPPRFGHPIVMGWQLARRVERLSADAPLRDLREHAERLLAVEVDTEAILDDLDTPLDLQRLRERLGDRSRGQG